MQTPEDILASLPEVRGRLRTQASLKKRTWFQVGGPAEIMFRPEDVEDLQQFLARLPKDMPITVLGVGSNIIVRDGGINGVVIMLGRGFTHIAVEGNTVRAGAAALDTHVARVAAEHGLCGLEFLSGVPGTVGGALAMNAGAYGQDVAHCLIHARYIDRTGTLHTVTPADFHYSYRHCALPESAIFIDAAFRATPGDPQLITKRMDEIAQARADSQPIRARTGGSTFKNPPGHKAWQLIDAAGCRGLRRGDAQVSEQHCNFLINHGDAGAHDLERLGEEVRERVHHHSGIWLEWEIKRLGHESGT